MAEAPPLPAPESCSSAAAAATRGLPRTILVPPSPSGGRNGRAAAAAAARRAAGSRERGRRKGSASAGSSASAGARGDRLVDAVRMVGKDVDAGVAGADILELAMAKGPMFSWLSYWPEEGYPKEGHPY